MKRQFSFVKRRFVKPAWPKNENGKIMLHIGCGDKNDPLFINIDARPFPHVHIVTENITKLGKFEDSSVDLIYMCHVLEHFKDNEIRNILSEMKRVLKTSGILRLSVPDFDRILEIYHGTDNDINAIKHILIGGQNHEFNIHYSVYNRKYLTQLLLEVGFQKVSSWDPSSCNYYSFRDFASKKVIRAGKQFFVSLNLEATF
jgi:predicted SAM-dependent methyltransferase